MFQSVQLLDKFQCVNAQQWNSKEKVQKLELEIDFSTLLIKEKKTCHVCAHPQQEQYSKYYSNGKH